MLGYRRLDVRKARLLLELGIQDIPWLKVGKRIGGIELRVELERICRVKVKLRDKTVMVRGWLEYIGVMKRLVLKRRRKRSLHCEYC